MTEFSIQQRRELKKLLARPPNIASGHLAENFLLKYVFLEALCRLIGKYYRERLQTRKKTATKSPESIQIDVVSRTFAHFGIQLRPERLASVMGSSLDTRGAKSARNLRNGIVHRWDKNDVAEATERYSSLCLDLDSVVDAIAHRVHGVQK